MTGPERAIAILRARVKRSSCRSVAEPLGVTHRMVWRWLQGDAPLPAWVLAVVLRGEDPTEAQARLGTRARRGYGSRSKVQP